MTETTNITQDEARAMREALRQFRATKVAAATARRDRRAERAEELERHRAALDDAELVIAARGKEINALDEQIKALREQIKALRAALDEAEGKREAECDARAKAYADRNAARDAIRRLNAEIREGGNHE